MEILYPGMLFTASTSWLLFLFGLFVAYSIWQAGRKDMLLGSFALFWLLFSLVWFSIGMRHFFASLGEPALDRNFYLAGQTFIYLHIVPAGFYIYLKLLKKKWLALSFGGLFLILALTAILAFFKYGFVEGPMTDFTTEYVPNQFSLNIFQLLLFLGVPLFYYHIIRTIFIWLKNRKITDISSFLASLSIALYASLGYFDQKGFMANWSLVFLRLSYLFALLLAYLSLISKKPSPGK